MRRLTLERIESAVLGKPSSSISLVEALEEEFQAQRGDLPYVTPTSDETRLQAFASAVHGLTKSRSAICLSGGGIRSATFALGILQGLARCGLITGFDYLSTVSGGGYIGSWLSAWAKRHSRGMAGVQDDLSKPTARFFDPEPDPLRHLREYSNYLTPRAGIASMDTWTVVATVLRNLILHWLLLLPLLSLIVLVPRWYLAFLRSNPSHTQAMIALGAADLLGLVGMSYIAADLPSIGNRRGTQAKFLVLCLLPLWLSAISVAVFWYERTPRYDPHLIPYLAAGTTLLLLALLVGYLYRRRKRRFHDSPNPWRAPTLIGAASAAGALGGLGTWYLAQDAFPSPHEVVAGYVCLAPALLLLLLCLVGTLFVGLTSRLATEQDREWWARSGGWFLLTSVGWIVATAIVFYGPELPSRIQPFAVAAGGLGGLTTAILGYSARTKAKPEDSRRRVTPLSLLLRVLPALFAATVFGVLSALATSMLSRLTRTSIIPFDLGVVATADVGALAILTLALIVLALVMGFFINVNKFSLHALYRNRLIRAYLGASHPRRNPNPLTGFDEDDDIKIYDLGADGPLHVLNLTLNLVDDNNLAWQQRKAESFTVSRLHSGSARLQYRPSGSYADGITLGTAAAISGAAASPNMGYHSSPPITFLMTLFNARLGWWLGNPGPAGDRSWKQSGPRFAPRPVLAEAFGLTNADNPYVYLSDGGHFENLGLYEMVLRRCHIIVASDAGCDSEFSFDDLANAIRKIRIDLGISITFDDFRIGAPGAARNSFVALGTIHYDCVDHDAPDGYLVYLKPTIVGGEPSDVLSYRRAHPEFPHESTSDQWFDEAQFESYRSLGAHVIEALFGQEPPTSPVGIPESVKRYLGT